MRTPFPGMDPWLEHPDLWTGVHNALIAAIQSDLAPRLRPKYVARIEERTYLSPSESLYLVGRPDMSVLRVRETGSESEDRSTPTSVMVEIPVPDRIKETWLEIRSVPDGEVITEIELLSPSNKSSSGKGHRLYRKKRARVFESPSHFVEIDLIRAGGPLPVSGSVPRSDYRILVSRCEQRPRAELFPFGVRDPVPRIRIPLRAEDPEPPLDLGPLVRAVYESGGFDLSIDYGRDPVPPLRDEDVRWADDVLTVAGVRRRPGPAGP